MNRVVVRWHGPYKIGQLEPLRCGPSGWGYYVFIDPKDDRVIYIGGAYSESVRRRIKSHFSGETYKIGKCVGKVCDVEKNVIKVGYVESPSILEEPLYEGIENLLIYNIRPQCNKRGKQKCLAKELEIINVGENEPELEGNYVTPSNS